MQYVIVSCEISLVVYTAHYYAHVLNTAINDHFCPYDKAPAFVPIIIDSN